MNSQKGANMKKFIETASAVLMIIGLATGAMASIEGSPHDISTQQCDICHSRSSGSGSSPEWNTVQAAVIYGIYNAKADEKITVERSSESMAYTLYNSGTSDMNDDPQLGPQSLLCLGCHNGIFSNIIKGDGGDARSEKDWAFEAPLYRSVNIDNELKNDHPVGFSYEPKRDVDGNNFPAATMVPGKSDSRAVRGNSGTMYPLYGAHHDRFECTTCHNPHYGAGHPVKTGKQSRLLLRADNSRSMMCRDCHKAKY
jgi:hypothetical protein